MLPAVSINHASTRSSHQRLGICLLLLGLLSAMALLVWMHQQDTARQRLESEIQRMQAPASTVRLSPKENQLQQQEMATVQAAINDLALPWQSLFMTLENMPASDIRIVAIEPNAKLGKLKLTANAADIVQMFGYVNALSGQDIFSDVVLVSHEYHPGQDMPVQFVVEAIWGNK